MNRESYPSSQSPLTGDVSGAAGATSVTVTGWQGIPVDAGSPVDMAQPVYDSQNNVWHLRRPGNVSVVLNATPDTLGNLIGGVIISSDYAFLCNDVGLEVLVGWAYGFSFQVFVDGVGVAG